MKVFGTVYGGATGKAIVHSHLSQSYESKFLDFCDYYVTEDYYALPDIRYNTRPDMNLFSHEIMKETQGYVLPYITSGSLPESTLQQFTTANHTTATYVTSSNFILKDVNLEGISVHTIGAYKRRSSLITPQHVMFAAHAPLVPGTTLRFVKKDGSIVERQILQILTQTSSFSATRTTDLGVALLDEPILDIEPVKVVGPSIYKITGRYENRAEYRSPYTTNINVSRLPFFSLPLFVLPRNNKLLFRRSGGPTTFSSYSNLESMLEIGISNDTITNVVINGDSGSPIFYVYNQKPYVVGCLTFTYGSNTPTVYDYNWEDLQEMITTHNQHPSASGFTLTDAISELTGSFYNFKLIS